MYKVVPVFIFYGFTKNFVYNFFAAILPIKTPCSPSSSNPRGSGLPGYYENAPKQPAVKILIYLGSVPSWKFEKPAPYTQALCSSRKTFVLFSDRIQTFLLHSKFW